MLIYDDFRAMNTDLLLAAEGEQEALAPVFRAAREYVAGAEARFTRFKDGSELNALNRAAGNWFSASAELYELMSAALGAYNLTGGLFDPAVLPELEYAGYDRSMDELRGRTLPAAVDRPGAAHSSFAGVAFDLHRRALRLPADIRVDLGGIAKGWIAARAAEILAAHAAAGAVNAGGDMVLFGVPEDPSGWQVGLEDPRRPGINLAVLKAGPGAVATSSVLRRRWKQGQAERHHIIDPRTGAPAETPWLSVTVWAEQAVYAEVFAKSLLIAGPDAAWRIAEPVSKLEFIAVQSDGSLVGKIDRLEVYDVPKSLN